SRERDGRARGQWRVRRPALAHRGAGRHRPPAPRAVLAERRRRRPRTAQGRAGPGQCARPAGARVRRRAPVDDQGQSGMIVRISTEGQYEFPDSESDRLNALDNQVVEAVDAGDEDRFHELYASLLELVRPAGAPVPDDELVESDVIFPPPDATLDEAGSHFTGEGLI